MSPDDTIEYEDVTAYVKEVVPNYKILLVFPLMHEKWFFVAKSEDAIDYTIQLCNAMDEPMYLMDRDDPNNVVLCIKGELFSIVQSELDMMTEIFRTRKVERDL